MPGKIFYCLVSHFMCHKPGFSSAYQIGLKQVGREVRLCHDLQPPALHTLRQILMRQHRVVGVFLEASDFNYYCSVAKSCNPMSYRMPGFPVFHCLPEFAQTYVYWVGDGHPSSSFSVVPFSFPKSFPASGSFSVSWLLSGSGQSIGASAPVLPMNIQGWFPLGLIGLISLLLDETLKSLIQHCISKASILQCSAFLWPKSHIHTCLLEKP